MPGGWNPPLRTRDSRGSVGRKTGEVRHLKTCLFSRPLGMRKVRHAAQSRSFEGTATTACNHSGNVAQNGASPYLHQLKTKRRRMFQIANTFQCSFVRSQSDNNDARLGLGDTVSREAATQTPSMAPSRDGWALYAPPPPLEAPLLVPPPFLNCPPSSLPRIVLCLTPNVRVDIQPSTIGHHILTTSRSLVRAAIPQILHRND